MAIPVIPRDLVHLDEQEHIVFLRDNASPARASEFIDAYKKANGFLSDHPDGGSNRLRGEIDIPHLQILDLVGFGMSIYFINQGAYVDVLALKPTAMPPKRALIGS
ncbi:MAG TPA: hypothetical protein VMV39_02760 [Terracidiphilus sp.]|nr:hypothetical protein [Terracidiphilus sp.]